ncbi:unnamed protein product [Urochloa humidicola]
MAMAGAVPAIVVLALGAGALGGPDALRLLIEIAGPNPAFDIGIIVFLISMFAVQLLGTLLLARYVRKPPPAGVAAAARRGAPRAPVADCFARITLVMSLAAAALVTACHVLVSGGPGSVARLLVGFVAEYSYPTVIAAAATGVALYAAHLLGAFREQQNARGGAAPAERATTTPTHAARFIGARLAAAGGAALPWIAPLLRAFGVDRNVRGRAAHAERATTTNHGERAPLAAAAAAAVCALVVAITFGACGGLDAHRLSPRPSFTNMLVAVAVVVGAALLVSFHRRARNAAAGAAPAAPATASAR